MPATVKSCVCAHPAQDKRYGPSMRVHNSLGKKREMEGKFWRCSVCKAEKGK